MRRRRSSALAPAIPYTSAPRASVASSPIGSATRSGLGAFFAARRRAAPHALPRIVDAHLLDGRRLLRRRIDDDGVVGDRRWRRARRGLLAAVVVVLLRRGAASEESARFSPQLGSASTGSVPSLSRSASSTQKRACSSRIVRAWSLQSNGVRGSDCSAVALSAPSSPSADGARAPPLSEKAHRGVCTHSRSSSGYARSGVKKRGGHVRAHDPVSSAHPFRFYYWSLFGFRGMVSDLESALFDTL
jgi:hypothetical protein